MQVKYQLNARWDPEAANQDSVFTGEAANRESVFTGEGQSIWQEVRESLDSKFLPSRSSRSFSISIYDWSDFWPIGSRVIFKLKIWLVEASDRWLFLSCFKLCLFPVDIPYRLDTSESQRISKTNYNCPINNSKRITIQIAVFIYLKVVLFHLLPLHFINVYQNGRVWPNSFFLLVLSKKASPCARSTRHFKGSFLSPIEYKNRFVAIKRELTVTVRIS